VAARDLAWKWFDFHASQRLTMIRFYITVGGALGGGVGYLYVNRQFVLSALLSLFGTISALCFARLDRRVADLIKIGENALKVEQARLANNLRSEAFKICELADEKPGSFPYSYRHNFQFLLGAVAFLFTIVLVMSVAAIGART
jgi:hypothetical protein